ncbi:MAG: thermonuclease family protein [Neptuniibacter sp.]
MRILKKALPIWSAFFLACSFPVWAQCPFVAEAEKVEVAYVYDGDTVRLKDGRKVRLIGINTPETSEENKPAEVFADEATEKLSKLLSQAEVSLLLGAEKKDRYKRWLGHLFADEVLVSEYLLREGLAFHIAIPPNTRFSDCLKVAEIKAENKGLWGQNSALRKSVSELGGRESGFRVLTGTVTSIRKIRNAYLLVIEKKLAVKVDESFVDGIDLSGANQLKGREVRVRGWIKPKKASDPTHYLPWFLVIRHSSQLEWL